MHVHVTSPHVQGASACACAFVGVGSVYYTPLHESPVPKPWPEAAFNPCHTVPHTVAAAALSFEDETKYVAVITAAATAVLTWSEYRNHGQKLILFSTAVHALQSRIMWWDSLRPAEQTPSKFKDLVLTSEQIIEDARPLGTLALHELASGGKEAEEEIDGGARLEAPMSAEERRRRGGVSPSESLEQRRSAKLIRGAVERRRAEEYDDDRDGIK